MDEKEKEKQLNLVFTIQPDPDPPMTFYFKVKHGVVMPPSRPGPEFTPTEEQCTRFLRFSRGLGALKFE
jgi:hypothetical protein